MALLESLRRLFRRDREPGEHVPTRAAIAANQRGIDAGEAGRRDDELRHYLEATRLDPGWATPWFNLGIQYKLTGRWPESRDASARALALDPGEKAAAWNLGIAATALGEWAEARRAWRAYGLEVPDGEGPVELRNLGPVAIRVGGEEAPEVVWCDRLDPARGRIVTVPLSDSGRCAGDVVLHDGVPVGHRMLGDREVPVFDELELLVPSRASTWSVDVTVPTEADRDALLAGFERRGVPAEDRTTMLRILCKACSEGNPDLPAERHDAGCGRRGWDAGAPWRPEHAVAAAAADERLLREVLAEWAAGGSGRAHGELTLSLDAGARSH
jgi:hypothetical protein